MAPFSFSDCDVSQPFFFSSRQLENEKKDALDQLHESEQHVEEQSRGLADLLTQLRALHEEKDRQARSYEGEIEALDERLTMSAQNVGCTHALTHARSLLIATSRRRNACCKRSCTTATSKSCTSSKSSHRCVRRTKTQQTRCKSAWQNWRITRNNRFAFAGSLSFSLNLSRFESFFSLCVFSHELWDKHKRRSRSQ